MLGSRLNIVHELVKAPKPAYWNNTLIKSY